ncbi:phage exclusion protein Lit family protein [Porphyromonas levii]|uniref:phage exclusion protein Lit family protein n=1 Tax=Porphyromonas levii TaxID=28114 RepID=UPI001B8B69ED|nr:phage exclusion protein Lit family protein [Porphyromonas levii]MBR8769604.1 hypothetical protein [Porphyromonas levii]
MNGEYMHYPVGVLADCVLALFHKLNDILDFQNALDNGLNREIVLVLTDKPITEVAELTLSNQIKLYDNFCQFYWCLCYSSMVMYDLGISKKQMEQSFTGNIDLSDDECKLAFDVFSAGLGLLVSDNHIRTERPRFFDLPNPFNNNKKLYVDLASSVYCYGICFILYHEYSHFDLEHSPSGTSKEDEIAADSKAFWMIEHSVSDTEKITARMGVLTALCALVFLDGTMKGGECHPDGDHRVSEILKNFDEEYDGYWGLTSVIFRMWVWYYQYDDTFPVVETSETWKDYFNVILNYLEDFKVNSSE